MENRNSSGKFSVGNLVAVLAGLMYFFFIRPQLTKWGTRLGEVQRRLTGDDRIPQPNFQATKAVDIDAPIEAIWPWLAQMGRTRTGWYSLDVFTNNGIPSATYIRKDLGQPQSGMALDMGLQILDLESGRLLLLGGYDLPNWFGTSTDVTRLYLLEKKSMGGTRLLVRTRIHSYGVLGKLFNLLLEPVDFVLTQQQLIGLKARAETMAYLQIPIPLEHEISLN
ncbi:hypothetical protein ACFLYO_00790 [Chloroflexota bacterium]